MGEEDSAGGSEALGQLIDDHGEAVDGDLLQYYGVNLVAVLRGDPDYPPRRVLSLLRTLPEGARLPASQLVEPALRNWTTQAYLTAATANNVLLNTMVKFPKNKRKGFDFIQPPKAKKKNEKRQTIGDVARMFGGDASMADLPPSLRSKKKRK